MATPFRCTPTQTQHSIPVLWRASQVNLPGAGFIKQVDSTYFPGAGGFAGGIVRQEPGSIRQLHWHLEADEWQFGVNGTLEIHAFNGTGQVWNGTLSAGDIGFIPLGVGHYLVNSSPEPAYFLVVFNHNKFSTTSLPGFIGNLPSEVRPPARALLLGNETPPLDVCMPLRPANAGSVPLGCDPGH